MAGYSVDGCRHALNHGYYGIKKVGGKRKERALKTTDRKLAERRLKAWLDGLSLEPDTNYSTEYFFGGHSIAMPTELRHYKAEVYRAVGSRWYVVVNKQMSLLGPGTVHFTYNIHSDGNLEILADPDKNNSSVLLLHAISFEVFRRLPFSSLQPIDAKH